MKNSPKVILSAITNVADRTAEQARFFLGLQQNDADIIIDQIKGEKSADKKILSLFRLLLDRLSALDRAYSCSQLRVESSLMKSRINNDDDIIQMKNRIDELEKMLAYEKQKGMNISRHINNSSSGFDELVAVKDELERVRAKYIRAKQVLHNMNNDPFKQKYEKIQNKYRLLKKEALESQCDMEVIKEKLNQFGDVVSDLKLQIRNKIENGENSSPKSSENANSKSTRSELGAFDTNFSSDSARIVQLEAENKKLSEIVKNCTYPVGDAAILAKTNDEIFYLRNKNIELNRALSECRMQKRDFEAQVQELNSMLENQVHPVDYQRLRDSLASISKRCDELQAERTKMDAELLHLRSKTECLIREKDTFDQRIEVFRAELATMAEERRNLLAKLDEKTQNEQTLDIKNRQQVLESDTMKMKLNDATYKVKTSIEQIEKLEEENKLLKKEIVRLETQLTKLKDQLYQSNQRNIGIEENCYNIKKFGFKLADALCANFNPMYAEEEVDRLIGIVKFEHNELNNTSRMHMNQFDRQKMFNFV